VLHASLLLSPHVALTSALAGGALLVLAGLYQMTPWEARVPDPLSVAAGIHARALA